MRSFTSRNARSLLRRISGQPLLVVVAVLATTLLAFAGCGVSPVAAPPTAQQIFDNAAHSKMKDATIAITGSVSSNIAGSSTIVSLTGNGQVVMKPTMASHISLTLNLAGAATGAVTANVITIGNTAYTKTQLQIPGLPTTNSNLYTQSTVPVNQGSSLIPQTASNVKLVGEDTIRGDKCWHLTGTSAVNDQGTPVASGTGGANSVNFDMWIRESDYYYARIKLNTLPGFGLPLGGATGTDSSSSSAVGFIIDLSNYDQGITISPPPADQIQS